MDEKKQATVVNRQRKSLIHFLLFNGFKSTFSLAGHQTTTTRFYKHGLSYINTHTETSSVDGQKKKKQGRRKRWTKWGQDATRNSLAIKMGDKSRECKSSFSISSKQQTQSFHLIPKTYRLLKVRSRTVRRWDERHCERRKKHQVPQ